MPYTPGSTVIRFHEAPPNRATIKTVRGMMAYIEYEEGGGGFWPLDALEEVIEGPNYQAFYDALIASPVYQAISMKAALFQPLLAASTEFIAAFADAKAGRPNPDAIRMTVWKLLYWLQPSAEELAMLQEMMDAADLSELYPLEIPAPVLAALNNQPNPFRFYESILASNFFTTKLIPIILSGTSSVPGDVATLMDSAIKDVMAGRVPPPTPGGPPNSLQTRLWLFTSAVEPFLDEEDFVEMQNLLESANLADLYTLTPPPQ